MKHGGGGIMLRVTHGACAVVLTSVSWVISCRFMIYYLNIVLETFNRCIYLCTKLNIMCLKQIHFKCLLNWLEHVCAKVCVCECVSVPQSSQSGRVRGRVQVLSTA